MASRNLLLLLVILMAQHLDMGVSSPIHRSHNRNCHWNKLKNETQNLYHQALKIYYFTNSTDTVLDDVPRILCHHHCGPENLSHPKTCLERISHVLAYYKNALSTLPESSQNEDFANVKQTILRILSQLEDCGYMTRSHPIPQPVTGEFLKKNIGTPLLSVSIHIARVFSPGNPEHHTKHLRH